MKTVETDRNNVAIVGLSCRFPGAANTKEFWANLESGTESITRTKRSLSKGGKSGQSVIARGTIGNADLFDAALFNISPRDAQIMDPQQRVFLECVCHAFEDACIVPDSHEGLISCYASCGVNTYYAKISSKLISPAEKYYGLVSNLNDSLATRTAYAFNLRGEAISVQTACSSSLVSVHLACQSLISRRSDVAVAGGVNINLFPSADRHQQGMIYSPNGRCSAFSKDAQGMVEGDGCGVVILKRFTDAIRDRDHIHGVILATALNNDGAQKSGFFSPNVEGQCEAIAIAIALAGISAEDIGYVEAHGTGTPIGDAIEIRALTEAFRMYTGKAQFCAIGSVKPNIGHLIHASGIAGLIKAALMCEHGRIPPSINCLEPDPELELEKTPFFIPSTLCEWKQQPRIAAVSSLGIGGTNAHLILSQGPLVALDQESASDHLVTLSARTPGALEAAKLQLQNFIRQHEEIPLSHIVYSLNTGRKQYDFRWSGVAESIDELLRLLGERGQVLPVPLKSQCADSGCDCTWKSSKVDLLRFSRLWESHHISVDWALFYKGARLKKVPLPGYCFERQSYWLPGRKGLTTHKKPGNHQRAVSKAPASEISRDPLPAVTSTELPAKNPAASTVPSESLRSEIKEIISTISGVREVPDAQNLIVVGIDSMLFLDAVEMIEQKFGVSLLIEEVFTDLSINGLAKAVEKALRSGKF